jgi:hypothetical protein
MSSVPLFTTTVFALGGVGFEAAEEPAFVQPLGILIAYDHGPSVRRALRAARLLASRFPKSAALKMNFCRFDRLEDRAGRDDATREAGAADLIIVSTADDAGVTSTVSCWLEECLAGRGETEVALLTLSGSTDAWILTIHHESGFGPVRYEPSPLELMDPFEPTTAKPATPEPRFP